MEIEKMGRMKPQREIHEAAAIEQGTQGQFKLDYHEEVVDPGKNSGRMKADLAAHLPDGTRVAPWIIQAFETGVKKRDNRSFVRERGGI